MDKLYTRVEDDCILAYETLTECVDGLEADEVATVRTYRLVETKRLRKAITAVEV